MARPIADACGGFRSGIRLDVRAHEPPQRRFARDDKIERITLYRRTLKNSSADLRGSRNRSDITATESAPASMTEAAFARVMPPIATRGFRVKARARRATERSTTRSGFYLD